MILDKGIKGCLNHMNDNLKSITAIPPLFFTVPDTYYKPMIYLNNMPSGPQFHRVRKFKEKWYPCADTFSWYTSTFKALRTYSTLKGLPILWARVCFIPVYPSCSVIYSLLSWPFISLNLSRAFLLYPPLQICDPLELTTWLILNSAIFMEIWKLSYSLPLALFPARVSSEHVLIEQLQRKNCSVLLPCFMEFTLQGWE